MGEAAVLLLFLICVICAIRVYRRRRQSHDVQLARTDGVFVMTPGVL